MRPCSRLLYLRSGQCSHGYLPADGRTKRFFWSHLTNACNLVDRTRVTDVGPEVACAEWILKSGGKVKWKSYQKFVTDYNALVGFHGRNRVIETIDATDSYIGQPGFAYLYGLKGLSQVIIHNCNNVDNSCVGALQMVKETLIILHLAECANVTADGVREIAHLKNLKYLYLKHVGGLNDDTVLRELQRALPKCEIEAVLNK